MKKLLLCTLLAVSIARAESPCLLEGPAGTSVRIAKFLTDAGQDYASLYRSGAVVIRARPDGSECVQRWGVAVPLPAFDELPPLAEARLVLDTPAHDRVFENGKWRVKTPAEQEKSPGKKRAARREAARTALVAELQSAGFTNATFSVDDVRDWVDVATLNAAQEKRVTRLLDKFVTLSREPLDIVK